MTTRIFIEHECDNCGDRQKGNGYPKKIQLLAMLMQKSHIENDIVYSLPTGWVLHGYQSFCHTCSVIVDKTLEKILEMSK